MKQLIIFVLCIHVFSCNDKKDLENKSSEEETAFEIKFKEGDVMPFAPVVFSQFTNVRDFTVAKEENEAYFTLLSTFGELSVIMQLQQSNTTWKTPKIASFSGRYTDLEPFLSPNGLRLYFASNRPVSKDSTNVKDFDIWYVKRDTVDAEWSQPINLGAPVNSELDEFYPSVTLSNNLYFTTIKKELESEDDIFMCEWKNGSYTNPVPLGAGINTKGAEFNAFVAPDESYMVFSGWRRADGFGSGDLYMSKRENGQWQTATNLGMSINSKNLDYCPFVNTETGMLYFTSRRSNINKKNEGYTNFKTLISEIDRYDNGSSRIYTTDFSKVLNKTN